MNRRGFLRMLGGTAAVHFLAPPCGWAASESGVLTPKFETRPLAEEDFAPVLATLWANSSSSSMWSSKTAEEIQADVSDLLRTTMLSPVGVNAYHWYALGPAPTRGPSIIK